MTIDKLAMDNMTLGKKLIKYTVDRRAVYEMTMD